MAERPTVTAPRAGRLGRLREHVRLWIGARRSGAGDIVPDHAGLAELEAWQWRLIERLALSHAAGGEGDLADWRRRRNALRPASDRWGFVLDAVEAHRRSRQGDPEGAADGFRNVVERLRRRCAAAWREAGHDEDGHDLEFLRLALAVALTRLTGAVEATDADEAESLLREAFATSPREAFFRERLVQFLVRRGRWDDAEACARGISTVDTTPARQLSDQILGEVFCDLAKRPVR